MKINKFLVLFFLLIFSKASADVSAVLPGDIVINEIMAGQSADADNEFIELYNRTGNDIDLTGFSLKKKTSGGTESSLVSASKMSGVIPAYGFFLISSQKFKDAIAADLAYSGATYYISANNTILLYNKDGNLLDKVGYGNANDYETATTTNPENDKSISRVIVDSVITDTDNNFNDFEILASSTPSNSLSPKFIPTTITPEQPVENNAPTTTLPSVMENQNQNNTDSNNIITIKEKYNIGDVLINEFVSDPADGDVEWVELFDVSGKEIDLASWTIEDGTGAKTVLKDKLGSLKLFSLIMNPKGNLNNDGDVIILRDSYGSLIDKVVYGNWKDGSANAPAAGDPYSVARKFDGYNTFNNANDFSITSCPTKGRENMITDTDIEASASATSTPVKDEIVLDEIFPNPKGDDRTGEFIELYNKGNNDIDLTGWKIEDDSGKAFIVKGTSTVIKAKDYYLLKRSESKIALDNSGGKVKIYRPGDKKIYQSVKYGNADEDSSYVLYNNDWAWSEIATPGKENILKTKNHPPKIKFYPDAEIIAGIPAYFDSTDTFDEDDDALTYIWDFGDGTKSSVENPDHIFIAPGKYTVILKVNDGKSEVKSEKSIKVKVNKEEGQFLNNIIFGDEEITSVGKTKNNAAKTGKKKTKIKNYIKTTLEEIKNLDVGENVIVNGTVAVKPGVYGTQYFYIVGSPGIQVYNYYKDFPDLKVGDYIEVKGELTESGSEMKVKIAGKEDIKIIKNIGEPKIEKISSDNLNGDFIGRLVEITGEITDKKGQRIYIDDGNGEIMVYIKKGANIDSKLLAEGKTATIRGMAILYRGSVQVQPRSNDDIVITDLKAQDDNKGVVLGAEEKVNEFEIAKKDRKIKLLEYGLTGGGVAGFLMIARVLRLKKKEDSIDKLL